MEIAEVMKKEWLELWTPKFTCSKAQFIRKEENPERDLIEIIKNTEAKFSQTRI